MSYHRGLPLLFATLTMSVFWGSDGLLAQDFVGGFATRYTSSGSVDTTFANSGIARFFGAKDAVAAAADGENRVVIVGTRDGEFVVSRLLASGTLDLSFGADGVATKAFSADAEARAVAIDPGGRIYVAGRSSYYFAVACFTESGKNCAFGADSKVTTSFWYPAEAAAIAIGNDGRIVVGGRASYSTSSNDEMFAVARYTTSGVLDTSFGSGGTRLYDMGSATWPGTNDESISGLAIDSSGRILAAGTFSAQDVSRRFALLRIRADGVLDKTFGSDSTGMVNAFAGCHGFLCIAEASATSLVRQSDGKIVVAGSARLSGSGIAAHDVALARFLPDGSLDSAFGYNGWVRTYGGATSKPAR
jgi:uncharacterized delta-60 repeat protein